MTSTNQIHQALYLAFGRQQWAELRKSVPLTLSEIDLANLRGINENISLSEVTDIYLPLSRLLNLIVGAKQKRGVVLNEFLGRTPPNDLISLVSPAALLSGKVRRREYYKRYFVSGRSTLK